MSARGKVATPPGPGGVWLAPVGRRLVSAGISCEGETGGLCCVLLLTFASRQCSERWLQRAQWGCLAAVGRWV